MEKIKFDLSDRKGLENTIITLENLKKNQEVIAGLTATIDFKHLIDFVQNILNRLLDLFDSSKKLEKQMEIAKETIRVSRELGAKSIEITIDTKNKAELKAHIEEVDAVLKGKIQNGNKLTYIINFE